MAENVLLNTDWVKTASVKDVVKAVAKGAKVNSKDALEGFTPLMKVIIFNKNPEVIKQLLAFGAKTNVKNRYDYTPLMYAIRIFTITYSIH